MDFEKVITQLDDALQPEKSFDLVKRNLIIGGRRAVLYFIDGFIKDEVFEKMMEFFFKIKSDELSGVENMDDFSKRFIPYVEAEAAYDPEKVVTEVLSGPCALLLDGIEGVMLIDTRQYPARSITEPEKDRSLRGARDGFVETLIFNTAMIRRRIRDSRLRMEYHRVGTGSKVDVAICYIDGKVNQKLLKTLRQRLDAVKLEGISMTQQALSELLIPTSVFNPFPKVKFSERPDYASACAIEGKILLVMDNSPAVMILPTSFADFSKEANDYYFPPVTSSYIRVVRLIISLLTVYLTPIFLLFVQMPDHVPDFLKFMLPESKDGMLPILAQLLILEVVIDGLRLASLNTPENLSSSLSIIGGLLLSDFAIQCGWFATDCILYMSFVAIASFCQPSFEMGYAQKFMRIVLLVAVQLWRFWGLLGGTAFFILVMLLSQTMLGKKYCYPVFPFNAKDFAKLFVRTRIK